MGTVNLVRPGNRNGFIVRDHFAILLYEFIRDTESIRQQRGTELTAVALNTDMEQARLEAIQRLWGADAVTGGRTDVAATTGVRREDEQEHATS